MRDFDTLQTPTMKSTEEIYENSMLEDDPNVNSKDSSRNVQQPRWGPKNKGAQILANFYSKGKFSRELLRMQITRRLDERKSFSTDSDSKLLLH